MSTKKKGRGRPTTRSNEAMMLAIWTLVQEEIHLRGARDIRPACDRVFEKKDWIKFITPGGQKDTRISNAATLRQWYQAAERARDELARDESDLEIPGEFKYPHLHQRAEYLARALPEMAALKKADMAQLPDMWLKKHG